MTYLLITLLIQIFGSDSDEIFMVPEVMEQIKKHVEDEDRKDKVVAWMKEGKTEIKANRKTHKKYLKSLKKSLSKDHISSEEVKSIIFNDFNASKEMHTKLISLRLKIQEELKQNEWDKIISLALEPTEKRTKKNKKSLQKEKEAFEDLLQKTKFKVDEIITSSEKKEIIKQAFGVFMKEIKEQFEYNQEYTYSKNAVLRDKNATKEMLENIINQKNQVRLEVHESFHSFFKIAKENTTDQEWEAIRKAIKKMISH